MVSKCPLPYGWPLSSSKTDAPVLVKRKPGSIAPSKTSELGQVHPEMALQYLQDGSASSALPFSLQMESHWHLTALSLLTSILLCFVKITRPLKSPWPHR